MSTLRNTLFAAAACCTYIAGQASGQSAYPLPPFVVGTPVTTHYSGSATIMGVTHDDLLTAGLGALGLQSDTAPSVSSPPNVEELRRLAIYTNYRALVDITTGGGYTVLYGPNVRDNGLASDPSTHPGYIAGDETIVYAVTPGGKGKIALMVQVPDSYNPEQSCIVTATSSGSRGIYGAIATAGEWGLKKGCAVAYTDKGTGTGFEDLQNQIVYLLRGQTTSVSNAGDDAQFVVPLSQQQLSAYNATYPSRWATKHAFSRQNPEEDWGQGTLEAIQFAFYVLNQKFPTAGVNKQNTIVIASSVSNGGGSSLHAIEQDTDGLIDGAAVSEPQVSPAGFRPFTINQGGDPAYQARPTPLIDYTTFLNIYEPCAAVAQGSSAPFNLAPSPGRCASLQADGLLKSSTLSDQAAEAQQKINAYGFLQEQNFIQPVLWYAYVPQAIVVTYANAYGRFLPTDNLCGISFAATDSTTNKPVPLSSSAESTLFGTSNGIPPTAGINLVNNSAGLEDRASTLDQDLTAALCFRTLATGADPVTGSPAGGPDSLRVRVGQQQVVANGNLHGVPVIIVDGRDDDILPPNFVARAYFGLNAQREGSHSQLHYYEVTNANHLDDIIALPGFDTTLIPLQKYFIEAMNLMYAHLRQGSALPPSQVVHTVPRGGTPGNAPQITPANVPNIARQAGSNAIVYSNGTLTIPQ